MKILLIFIIFSTFIICPFIVSAHPGRTASDGCHYCRTNCEKWGEVEGARHCHNSGYIETKENLTVPTYVLQPTPSPAIPTIKVSPVPSKLPTVTKAINTEEDSTRVSSNQNGGEIFIGLALLGATYGGYKWLENKSNKAQSSKN